MNILDIAVLVLFAFFILAGWYRGFVNTVLSLGAFILAIALAFVMRPLVSNAVKGNEWLYNTALYYTEGAEFVDNVELAQTAVSNISADELNAVMDNATLPIPMAQRITENVASEAFAADGLSTLGEYFNQTIVNVFINLLSVLLLFITLRLLFAFVIHLVDYARRGYPVLQTADGLIGAGFGLVRGFVAMYALFMLAPVAIIVLPLVEEYITGSFFENFFYTSNLLLRLIPGA